jgi:hypothetical protein
VGNITISPDGQYLAALTGDFGGCAVALYSLSAAHDKTSLATIMYITGDGGSAYPSSSGRCNFYGPAWSPNGPDGPWLAFSCDSGCDVLAFPLQPYLQQIKASSQHMSFTLDPKQLLNLVENDYAKPYPSWTIGADGLRLNYITGSSADTIEQLSLSTRQTRTLVKIPSAKYGDGALEGLAPAPNFRSLIFIHGRGWVCLECDPGERPSHLYIYVPADA